MGAAVRELRQLRCARRQCLPARVLHGNNILLLPSADRMEVGSRHMEVEKRSGTPGLARQYLVAVFLWDRVQRPSGMSEYQTGYYVNTAADPC